MKDDKSSSDADIVSYYKNRVDAHRPSPPPAASPDSRHSDAMGVVHARNSDAGALAMKVESLQAQLTEQKQFNEERVAALLEDRRIRERDEEAHRQNYQKQIEALTAKLRRTEEALRVTTKDYILARRDKQAAQDAAAHAQADAAEAKSAAASKLSETKAALESKAEKAQKQADDKLASEAAYYKQQLKSRDMEISRLEGMHGAVKAQYEQRIQDLEAKFSKTKDKLKQVEYRRVLDSEGFTSDVSLLRKQLASVDRKLHQMRLLDRLEDDERLHSLLQQLQKKAPNSTKSPGSKQKRPGLQAKANRRQDLQADMLSETGEAADELRAIKENLLRVEDRVQQNILRPSPTRRSP